MYIGIVYHWSPKSNRKQILQHGLQLLQDPTCHTERFAYLCFGTSPSCAWSLSVDAYDRTEEVWDLWQVRLQEGDDIRILDVFKPWVQEVRTTVSIPPDRIWWVAERDGLYAHESMDVT